MAKKLYFTRLGLEKIRNEIEALKKSLAELQAQTAYVAEVGGDQYHDNSAYEMLVIDLRGIDRRLADAHRILNQAVVVEPNKKTDQVFLGTTVTILRDDEESSWTIAGFGESNPNLHILAYNTPLASMLMGKHVGDVISGIIAGKKTEIEIIKITAGGTDEDKE